VLIVTGELPVRDLLSLTRFMRRRLGRLPRRRRRREQPA